MKDQFLPRSSHTNLPDTDDEISVTPISTPGEANGQNEDEVEDISQEMENQSESVKETDECSTPSLRSRSEPCTILKKRCRKRTSDMDALLELEKQKMSLWREKHARQIPPTTKTTSVPDDDDKSFFDSLLPYIHIGNMQMTSDSESDPFCDSGPSYVSGSSEGININFELYYNNKYLFAAEKVN
nr:unnamed protein product [Callosobruchus chinensis]